MARVEGAPLASNRRRRGGMHVVAAHGSRRKCWQESQDKWRIIKQSNRSRRIKEKSKIPRRKEEGAVEPYMMYHKPTGKAY